MKLIPFTMSFLVFLILLSGCTNARHEPNNKNIQIEKSQEVYESFEYKDLNYIGKKGRFGFIKLNGTREIPFVNKEGALYFWSFWGEPNEFKESFSMKATNIEENQEVTIIKNIPVSEFNKSKDMGKVDLQFKITLPNEGEWRLDMIFGEEIFESIIVNNVNVIE